ncbi:hypothetical protein C6P46_002476 [Rhodotorula mucilaginosa]|uniref:Uncharacterized protein n=1 Tax=Rhodotorula mucilaginosa TaxID=5537 RepID=A0A9P7B1Q4_RHOMI|nr:hypothetical protein C6P46_002476 [Rhodotorula mucilaginosa]
MSSEQPAISPSPPLHGSGEIRHGRLPPRSLSAGWSTFKTAQKSTWLALWGSSGGQLRAVPSSPPGPSFSRFHSLLSCCQRTSNPTTSSALAAANPRRENISSSTARSTPHRAPPFSPPSGLNPSLTYLLSDLRATKATLRFLANSGHFDSLYCPPSKDPRL